MSYHGTSPNDETSFDSQLRRLYTVTGCTSQAELALFMGLKQATVSHMVQRGKIPDSWLMHLFRLGINPEWIVTGNGPWWIPATVIKKAPPVPPGFQTDCTIVENILKCIPSGTLRRELQRRREAGEEQT